MTKRLTYRIYANIMALLMLLSSTGFSIDSHYCQDQLKGISFYSKAKSCHDKQENPTCHISKNACQQSLGGISHTDKDDCCHNESIVIKKSDIEAPSLQLTTVQNVQLDFVSVFVTAYRHNFNVENEVQSFEQYIPPLPERDLKVLYQTFLI